MNIYRLSFYLALCFSLLTSSLFARQWTNTKGKKITADIVRVEGTSVVLNMNGKEVTVPIDTLCAADNDFIRIWQDEQTGEEEIAEEPSEDSKAGKGGKRGRGKKGGALSKYSINGVGLNANGKETVVEVMLDEETIKAFSKKKTITKMKISISLPSGFDPSTPQKVLWVSQAINNPEQQKNGNLSCAPRYAKLACPKGWVVIGVDVDGGNPRGYGSDADRVIHLHTIEYIAEKWPEFKKWKFATCGFSGGAKNSFYRICQLASAELNVVGAFIVGCNAEYMDEARRVNRCNKSDLKGIKMWVSAGKRDKIATVKQCKAVAGKLKSYFKTMKVDEFAGGHEINQASFQNALAWFLEVE